jgi:hypothetical protein
MDDAARKVQELVAGLGIKYGFERSFRTSAGQLLTNRFLLGFRNMRRHSCQHIRARLGRDRPNRQRLLHRLPRDRVSGTTVAATAASGCSMAALVLNAIPPLVAAQVA